MIGLNNIENMKTANECKMDPTELKTINEKQRTTKKEILNIFNNVLF